MKKEQGYTLVLVLIIITVLVILGLSVSSLTLNATKQFNKTDEHNKAIDLAEMGVTYYQSKLNSMIKTAQDSATNKTFLYIQGLIKTNNSYVFSSVDLGQYFNNSFCTELKKENTNSIADIETPVSVENPNGYQITSSTINCTNTNTVTAVFISKGTTANDSAILNGNLQIIKKPNASNAGQPAPDSSGYLLKNVLDLILKGQQSISDTVATHYIGFDLFGSPDLSITNNAIIDNLIIKGNSDLLIQGDGIFNNLSWMNGNVQLLVLGNAYFSNPVIAKGASIDICIYGNTYLINSATNTLEDYTLPLENKCKGAGGSWEIDTANGINIQY